ncbi:MAG: hypothetical protein K2W95_18870 [Candidatus Obscuribacterales bacterium]|nr:hypothetical protein [Candidatus Obscuribacterales bacterium]
MHDDDYIKLSEAPLKKVSCVLFKIGKKHRGCVAAALHCLLLSVVFFGTSFGPVAAFSTMDSAGGNIHAEITKEALSGIFSPVNLKVIIDANEAQDKPGSDGQRELRRHFGELQFNSSLGYVDREKKRALNYAAESDTDTESRGYALRHFGEMLHVVQDFYSRTNYIELMVRLEEYKTEPYQIPLVDWQKVPSGYPGLECFNVRAGASSDVERHAMMVKDSPRTPGGARIVNGKITYFQVARELAVRETQRQWNQFEAMIRNRCGSRAAAVIAAIKEASPETKISSEQEE